MALPSGCLAPLPTSPPACWPPLPKSQECQEALLDAGIGPNANCGSRAIGYRQALEALQGWHAAGADSVDDPSVVGTPFVLCLFVAARHGARGLSAPPLQCAAPALLRRAGATHSPVCTPQPWLETGAAPPPKLALPSQLPAPSRTPSPLPLPACS